MKAFAKRNKQKGLPQSSNPLPAVKADVADAWKKIPRALQTLQKQASNAFEGNRRSGKGGSNSNRHTAEWSYQNFYRDTTDAVMRRRKRKSPASTPAEEQTMATESVATSPLPPPSTKPEQKEEEKQTDDGITVGMAVMLVVFAVVVALSVAQGDDISAVPWSLVLPWLLTAALLGYELGTNATTVRIAVLPGEDLQPSPVVVDREVVLRDVHRRVTTSGYARPPLFSFRQAMDRKRILRPLWKQPLWSRVLRQRKKQHEESLVMVEEEEEELTKVARIRLPLDAVTSLSEFVNPPPLLKTLGMDLFFNGGAPVEKVSEHPALLQLRKTAPMVIVNGMTHIANVILYFELPDWVVSWDGITDDPLDSPETKVLKSFIKGTDSHRAESIFIVPSIVDAPLPVKMIAPAKSEIPCCMSQAAPSCWHMSSEDSVRGLKPAIELEMDLISSKMIRKVVGIVSMHVHKISLDVSCVIYDEQKTSSACLSCFCFDHVDMLSCPSFPMNSHDDIPKQDDCENPSLPKQ